MGYSSPVAFSNDDANSAGGQELTPNLHQLFSLQLVVVLVTSDSGIVSCCKIETYTSFSELPYQLPND